MAAAKSREGEEAMAVSVCESVRARGEGDPSGS